MKGEPHVFVKRKNGEFPGVRKCFDLAALDLIKLLNLIIVKNVYEIQRCNSFNDFYNIS